MKKEGKEGNEEEGLCLYNRDEQGSTSSIINSEGRTAAVYDYDEYGNTEVLSGDSFGNELCYTGQVRDKSTGLYYYNARFDDSSVGSFTSQDSYRGEYNNPLTQNLYTYCAGDPVNRIDPTRHSWLDKWYKKLTKSSKKRETSNVNRSKAKKAVKRPSKSAKKNGKKILSKRIRGTKQQEIFIYNAYYASGSRLKNGKKASLNQMKKSMRKKPNAIEEIIYTLPIDVTLTIVTGGSYAAGGAVHKGAKAAKVVNAGSKATKEVKIAKEASKTRGVGWKVGDPIDNFTAAGNEPSWSAARARYWKNEFYYNRSKYSKSDQALIKKGNAPKHPVYGVSKEIHHINGRKIDNPHNINNLQEVWPWDHDRIDPYRHYNGPRP